MNNVTRVLVRVLVVGQGGREHAIVRQIAQNSSIESVYVVPGSDGMMGTPKVECVAMSLEAANFDELLGFAKKNRVELIVIGPEQPLADGLADVARASGFKVFGPSKEGARLEASKIHAKELMKAAGVRTARSFVVTSVEETLQAAKAFRPPYVLKADGLAAGKGVFIEKTLDGLAASAKFLFVDKGLGAAGESALLEEFSPGVELSHLVLTNGKGFISMPAARDHKRLLDDDEGPNTGGMGVVAPVPLADGLLQQIENEIVAPVIREIEKRGFVFRGVLYFGLMLTAEGPSVLEFNTRFGDPEAQVLMTLLDEQAGPSWVEVLSAIAEGQMPKAVWSKSRSVACLVLAAEGYPDNPVRGVKIDGLAVQASADSSLTTRESEASYVLHAGTKRNAAGDFVTNGGRVLNVIGYSDRGLLTALRLAYSASESIQWHGRQIRRDIGRSILDRK